MKTKYSLLFLIVVFTVLISCKKQEPKNPFVVQVDDKRVELILENNAEYLIYDIPTKAKLLWYNIDVESGFFAGNGVRKLDFKDNETLIELNYLSTNLSDTLNLQLRFKGINDTEYSQGIIKVPVKQITIKQL